MRYTICFVWCVCYDDMFSRSQSNESMIWTMCLIQVVGMHMHLSVCLCVCECVCVVQCCGVSVCLCECVCLCLCLCVVNMCL